MALSTESWSDLVDLAGAHLGEDLGSNTKALARLKSLANLAAKRAYRSHRFWPRFLVWNEPRSLSRGYIDFTEDSFHVYGAGTEAVNGLYVRNGNANGKVRYSQYQSDGISVDWDIEWDGSTDWQILVGADHETLTEDTVFYDITDASATPPLSGWAADAGTTPSPLLVDVAEIDTIYNITIDGSPIVDGSGWSADRLVDSKGIYAEVGGSSVNQAYVTYKASLNAVYGDGTGGTTSDIPSEWFNYMALYAARQMQASSRQANPNQYVVVLGAEVQQALEDEHMKIEHDGIIDNLGRKIQTGISNSTMLT
jgi:hypothetical protein